MTEQELANIAATGGGDDLVTMTHPEVGGLAKASLLGFRQVWEPRGWVLVEPEVLAVSGALGRSLTSLDELTREELAHAATFYPGTEVSASDKKDDLVKAVRKAARASVGAAADDAASPEPTTPHSTTSARSGKGG